MFSPVERSSSPPPRQVQETPNPEAALPAPGQETLETWKRILDAETVSRFTESLESLSTEEAEEMRNVFQSSIGPLISGIMAIPEQLVKEQDEGKDLFQSLGGLVGRVTIPFFQETASQAGLPQESKEGFKYYLDAFHEETFPEMAKNAARTFAPEKASRIDAYTPYSAIGEMGLSCMRQPLENLFTRMARFYNPDFTRKTEDSDWNEEDAKGLVETLFSECSAELHMNRTDSIASRMGIAHPDTLEGRYQRLSEEEKGKERNTSTETGNSLSPTIEKTMSLFYAQGMGLEENEVKEIQQEFLRKKEEAQRMQCAVAGCRNWTEFEEKEKRFDQLKREATSRLDYKVRLQRDFEQIVPFLDNPLDRMELKNLFKKFEEDPEAYRAFNRGRDGVNRLIAENLFPKLAESMVNMREYLQGMPISEIPKVRNAFLKEQIANTLNGINKLLGSRYEEISDPVEKQGHYFMCKWFQKTGPSMLRLALAEQKPDYKFEKAMIELGHMQTYSKKEYIPLSEFDLKMATLMQKKDGAIDLDTLDLMREMDNKSDEEMVELLMSREAKEHETFVQTFSRSETASELSSEEEDIYADMPPLED